jgi:IclR family acetate operon transcriptional repressor
MPKPTSSVVTALRVIERVSLDQPIGVTELARALGLPKTSAHRMLTTLATAGWARQGEDGAWSLTLRAAVVGRRVQIGPAARAAAHPIMEELSVKTNETVRLWLIDGDSFVIAEELEGTQAVRPVVPEMSSNVPLHTTAVGKAVLASLPTEDFEAYLSHPLVSLTELTITDPEVLREHIASARARGYAQAWNEAQVGVGGVAALLALPGAQQAALAVTFPTHRLTDELVTQFGDLLLEAIGRIRHAVGNGGGQGLDVPDSVCWRNSTGTPSGSLT